MRLLLRKMLCHFPSNLKFRQEIRFFLLFLCFSFLHFIFFFFTFNKWHSENVSSSNGNFYFHINLFFMFIYHIFFCLSLFFDQHFLPSAVFVPSTLEDVQIRKKKHFSVCSKKSRKTIRKTKKNRKHGKTKIPKWI